jgi:hypothetical protein
MSYKQSSLLKMEESYHSVFHSLRSSSICGYPVRNVEETLTDYSEYGKLTTVRLNNHSELFLHANLKKVSPSTKIIKNDRWTSTAELIPQSLCVKIEDSIFLLTNDY